MLSNFDAARETDRLVSWIQEIISTVLKREGGVIGVSGGVDSATVLHLIIRALGPQRIVALVLPDRDSNPQSASLVMDMTAKLGVETIQTDLTGVLMAYRCYEWRDHAIQRAVPEFDPHLDKVKIVLPENLLGEATLNVFSVVVVKPDGRTIRRRLGPIELREIVAASNMKQRTRMTKLYHEAERRNYAVIGTTNKNEHGLGFFVKYGDGGVDVQPISHLFKTQVYALAKYLGVPEAIIKRSPSTDTYSAECTQEEFFYRLPFSLLDAIWEADEQQQTPEQIAQKLGLNARQIENVLLDLRRKQRTTEYLRLEPIVLNFSREPLEVTL